MTTQPNAPRTLSELLELWRKRAAHGAQRAAAIAPGEMSPKDAPRLAAYLAAADNWTNAADELERVAPIARELARSDDDARREAARRVLAIAERELGQPHGTKTLRDLYDEIAAVMRGGK